MAKVICRSFEFTRLVRLIEGGKTSVRIIFYGFRGAPNKHVDANYEDPPPPGSPNVTKELLTAVAGAWPNGSVTVEVDADDIIVQVY